jgi:hypothetical protein
VPVRLTATVPPRLAPGEKICAIGFDKPLPPDMPVVPDIARRLEAAFDRAYAPWRDVALKLQAQPGADLAHMPTISTYASDFGVMLAWLDVVRDLAGRTEEICVACSDPWLFRALASLDDVNDETTPGLAAKRLRFFCRGMLARTRAALRCLAALWRTRAHRTAPAKTAWLLVYGHPDSNAEGYDAYFGDLMRETAWLVERAAAIEGSGGSAAMTHWQMTCHANWLKDTAPKTVAWPWENHPWERDFVRAARRTGATTLGYQHTVVGRHMYNQGADANLDGTGSIPDRILLNGPSYEDDLKGRGIPASRMTVAGAHRIGARGLPAYDPKGPVFLALSNNPSFARQMVEACRPLASAERPFIVKDHPLNPYPVSESDNFTHTRQPIPELPAMRALIYCTGTTGLEGLLGGVPTYRFIPEGGIALDILPRGLEPVSVSAGELPEALRNPPEAVNHAGAADRTEAFPPPDMNVWTSLLRDERTEPTP